MKYVSAWPFQSLLYVVQLIIEPKFVIDWSQPYYLYTQSKCVSSNNSMFGFVSIPFVLVDHPVHADTKGIASVDVSGGDRISYRKCLVDDIKDHLLTVGLVIERYIVEAYTLAVTILLLVIEASG